MTGSETERALTESERLWVFKRVTAGLPRFHADRIAVGMTDEELRECLESLLGIFGGSSSPDQPSTMYKGSGLKIWGGWQMPRERDQPLFQGRQTLAMARTVYGIRDPVDPQLALF